MSDDYRENEVDGVTEEKDSLDTVNKLPSVEDTTAASENDDTSESEVREGDGAPVENKSVFGECVREMAYKSKRTARIIWACALSGVTAILLVLFLPIFFANHIENTFENILPDSEMLAELIEEIAEEAYSETLSVTVPKGLLSTQAFGIDALSYGTGTDADGRKKMTLTLNIGKDEVDAEIFIDGDTVTVGGIDAEGGRISFSRENFKEELSRSLLNPNSGASCALSTESYNELESIFDEFDSEIYVEFLDELLSGWRKVMDKESDISFGGIFKLEREVTYTASYVQLCNMLDVLYNVAKEKKLLNTLSISKKTIDYMKPSMKGVTIEFSYKVSGSEFLEARLHVYKETTKPLPVFNPEKEVVTDVTYVFRPIIENRETVGAEFFIDERGTVLDVSYKYLTGEDSEKKYSSITETTRKGESVLVKSEYEKATYRYSIEIILEGYPKQEISGGFRVDEKNGVVYISAKYKINDVSKASFLYEIKGDSTANSIAFESGVKLYSASDKELKSLLDSMGLGYMIKERS